MPCFLFNNFPPFFVSSQATFKLTGRNILGCDYDGPLIFYRMPKSGIGKANPPGSKFCNQCGNPFSNPSADIEVKGAFRPSQQLQTKPEPESLGKGERRQITTVFSDLSGYIEAKNFLEVALEALEKLPRTAENLEREIDLRFNMRSALFPLGRHDDWAEHIRVAESLAEQIHDETRLANAYNYLAAYNWIQGRHEKSIELGINGLRLALSAGNFSAEVTTKVHIGIPLLYTGEIKRQIALHREVAQQLSGPGALDRPEEALSILQNVTIPKLLESSIFPTICPLTVLAETYVQMGQTDKALQTAEEALRIFRQTGERCVGAWAIYVMAIIQSENDSKQIEEAPHTYRMAINLTEELNMKPLLAHCHLKLGQHYAKMGKTDMACSEFLNAIEIYRSLGMAFWLPMAEANLRDIDAETSSHV